ncbi:MAG: hypothetical protein EXQ82_09295 [Pseudolabrys sp.]|nr:hypothetical protein [Pseudolabrys sp.]
MRNGDRSADATAETLRPAATRPSIGLALGGGAARGFAHIGVMRTLAARGIVPDVIVGTSIGAVVGGCYAARELDSLETWARGLNVRNVLSYLDISLSGAGLIRGSHLAKQLERALKDSRIDDLPIRFAAIATEFNTGHEIWLTRGRLADALRASYALPGIFPPVIPTVMIEAFNVMQDRITRARLAGDPPDVLISPRLGPIGWFDFHRAQEAIAIGAEATEKAIDSISEAVAALSTPYSANGAAR